MMNIDEILKKLDGLFADEKLEEVEPFLLSCMRQAKAGDEYGIYISVGNELIGFYRSISRYEEAFAVAEDVLLLMEELQLEGTVHFATTLLNTATAYRAAGRYEEALGDYRRALEIYQRDLPKDDYRLAGLYNNISILLEKLDENEKSALFLQKAIQIVEKQPGSRLELATSRTNLALIQLKLNRLEEAKKLLDAACRAFEEDGGITDAHYSAALAGQGEVCYRQGGLERALGYYEHALFEVEKHFGRNQGYGLLCGNCSLVCRELGRKAEADEYERQRKRYCHEGD
ncbi:MAG: tetratricopeptide repeat protein [Eisenbergiella sp.]